MAVKIFEVKFNLPIVSILMRNPLGVHEVHITTLHDRIRLPDEASMVGWRGLQTEATSNHIGGPNNRNMENRGVIIASKIGKPIIELVMLLLL